MMIHVDSVYVKVSLRISFISLDTAELMDTTRDMSRFDEVCSSWQMSQLTNFAEVLQI